MQTTTRRAERKMSTSEFFTEMEVMKGELNAPRCAAHIIEELAKRTPRFTQHHLSPVQQEAFRRDIAAAAALHEEAGTPNGSLLFWQTIEILVFKHGPL